MRRLCRVLFSRYAVFALLILLEIVLLIGAFVYVSTLSYLFFALSLMLSPLTVIHVINRDINPEYKLSWVIAVLLLPFAGSVIYLLFSERKLGRRERLRLDGILNGISREGMRASAFADLGGKSAEASGKAMAILSEDPLARVYAFTESKYLSSGEEYASSLLRDLSRARRFIFLEYFIVDEGELWERIHAVLLQRIAEGVEVRMLYDDVGCMGRLPYRYDKRLREEGIRCYRFARVSPRVTVAHNHRDHRKICVIDGEIAYTGGVNLADEYINRKERFGHWKDGGVRIFGAATDGFTRLFLTLYDLSSGQISDYSRYTGLSRSPRGDGGYYLPFGSGPLPLYRSEVGKNAFLNLINQAKTYLYVTTPYLIIDYALTEAFCNAAARGVDVRIVVPHVPDKKLIRLLTRSAYKELLRGGVRIYEYTPGFLHEKLLVTDDLYAVIGSINLDYRSLVHHFESAVWIYASPTVEEIRGGFLDTLSRSLEVTPSRARIRFYERVVRDLIRFLAPLL